MLSFPFLLLLCLINAANATAIDVNGIAIENFHGSGILDDVEILIQEEAQVVNTLIELDKQLDHTLNRLSSASGGAVEIDVVVGDSDGSKSEWVVDDVVVEIPAGSGSKSRLSNEEKNEIKEEIKNEVADALDAMIFDEALKPPEMEQEFEVARGSLNDKVGTLFEEEADAEKELEQMKEELEKALDELPGGGASAEIDIAVSETDVVNEVEVVDKEIVVFTPASTGSGPRLTQDEKTEIEEEIVRETTDALGTIIMDDFMDDQVSESTEVVELELPGAPLLEEESLRGNDVLEHTWAPFKAVRTMWGDVADEAAVKPALREAAATTTAHTGFKRPLFVPHHWQMAPDDQLWTMKLSMLTSLSCLTLLLIVGIWTGVRRSRRRAILDDSHFRWAEAVEYMDAFPYDP